MKKLVFRGPVQTASGYGVHSRMLLKALDESGKFDITVMSIPWGATPLIYDDTPEIRRIKELAQKFNPNIPPDYDVSVQVTIPNEFMKLAPINVCVTAGIETDKVSPAWQVKTNEVADVLVVPSFHSARAVCAGIYNGMKGPQQILNRKPLYILPEWVNTDVFNTDPTKSLVVNKGSVMAMDDMPDFNFIVVGLGMDKAEGEDRKNLTLTVKWFCEQFKGSKDVGLILKVSMVNCSEVDFRNVKDRIVFIKNQTGCGGQFPKIKLIHGRLSDLEMATLYKHPKVKAFVTLTHGEGFGLPIIEAAACGVPVIATNWSGHLDFLNIDGKSKFVPIDFKLEPIPQSAVWEGVMEKDTRWANPIENDVKMKMSKVVMSYSKPKEWATELAKHIAINYNSNLGVMFAADVASLANGEKVRLTKHPFVKTSSTATRLGDVTLVAVSDVKMAETTLAMSNSLDQIMFNRALLITSTDFVPTDSRITTIRVDNGFTSVDDYDNFIAKKLADLVDTKFVQIVQWDGYVLNGSAWSDEFLNYDYIGAPWYWKPESMNSGFSLQSVKLLKELQKQEYEKITPYDLTLFNNYRAALETNGFKFAPSTLSSKYSVENQPYDGQFGWHGCNPFNGEIV